MHCNVVLVVQVVPTTWFRARAARDRCREVVEEKSLAAFCKSVNRSWLAGGLCMSNGGQGRACPSQTARVAHWALTPPAAREADELAAGHGQPAEEENAMCQPILACSRLPSCVGCREPCFCL